MTQIILKTKCFIFSVLTLLGIFISCSKKTHTRIELWLLTKKNDPTATLVIPDNVKNISQCIKYGPGCKETVIVKILGLDVIAVHFEDRESAQREAKRINAYYSLNWVFDDVMGEPILEDFVRMAFEAIPGYPPSPAPLKK